MIVVSDTSPIRALAFLRLVHPLQVLFGEIFIPTAVQRELLEPPASFPRLDVNDWSFFQVRQPSHVDVVKRLAQRLDDGEAEAIALALEISATTVLMDEAAGRAVAEAEGLTPLGTLGVLLLYKQRGIVSDVTVLIDHLETGLNFFIAPELRREVIRLASE